LFFKIKTVFYVKWRDFGTGYYVKYTALIGPLRSLILQAKCCGAARQRRHSPQAQDSTRVQLTDRGANLPLAAHFRMIVFTPTTDDILHRAESVRLKEHHSMVLD
ncbi:MAG: hypothetical protein AAGJ68_13965, partial [Pseudomonadota bacterium]